MWKKIVGYSSVFIFGSVNAQNFGEFASAVSVQSCGVSSFYNLTGSGANCINSTCGTVFQGAYFGTFVQNASTLQLKGAEFKSWKNAGANVCGGNLRYTLYATGNRPAVPVFSSISLPFKANCGGSTFTDGLGPCGGNDQKWSTVASSIDLTAFTPGNYSIEVYMEYFGDDFSTSGCGTTRYISNSGVNYIATFDIVASGSSCGITLPLELVHFGTHCETNEVHLTWSTLSEASVDYFELERSLNGTDWSFVGQMAATGTSDELSQYEWIDYAHSADVVYYSLTEVDDNGNRKSFPIVAANCADQTFTANMYWIPETEQVLLMLSNIPPEGITAVRITDVNGKQIAATTCDNGAKNLQILMDLPAASGLYFVSVWSNDQFLLAKKCIR